MATTLWSYTKRVYSLDTLDTRFTVSPRTPLQQSARINDADRSRGDTLSTSSSKVNGVSEPNRDVQAKSQPSKWNTAEYYFYYFVFLTIVPCMFYVPYTVSRESDPEYHKFEPLLSDGWIPGRKVDNSDQQYAGFRDNIPYMALLIVLHPLLRKIYDSFTSQAKSAHDSKPDLRASSRFIQRRNFDVVFAIIFIFALHGTSAVKVLIILYINFLLVTKLPRNMIPWAAWVFNMGILFANELCQGYPYSKIASALSPSPMGVGEKPDANWGVWLETFGGLIPRWEVLFNITILRLISFDMDYYWSLDERSAANGAGALENSTKTDRKKKKQLDQSNLSERDRIRISAAPGTYTHLPTYLSYALYSPLYLAGPILTFNDYISQLHHSPASITRSRTIAYAIRFLACLLTMELVQHFIYAVAISKSNPDWSHYTPFQLSMLGYFNLHLIWLKLLLPWRFFRLWSLVDGIDPPENMTRCMSDNYSALLFWRSWHRSFNRWLVRYLFIPLGGSQGKGWVAKVRYGVNMLLVFTFVALWHDISARLLAWGWLVVLFILPEIVATVLFPRRKFKGREDLYRWLCGLGAVGNILMMMAANLVGFPVGLDGLMELVKGIVAGVWGWIFLGMASGVLFVGVMVMFEVREEEKRKGIDLKC